MAVEFFEETDTLISPDHRIIYSGTKQGALFSRFLILIGLTTETRLNIFVVALSCLLLAGALYLFLSAA
jgi:hypothetical protein